MKVKSIVRYWLPAALSLAAGRMDAGIQFRVENCTDSQEFLDRFNASSVAREIEAWAPLVCKCYDVPPTLADSISISLNVRYDPNRGWAASTGGTAINYNMAFFNPNDAPAAAIHELGHFVGNALVRHWGKGIDFTEMLLKEPEAEGGEWRPEFMTEPIADWVRRSNHASMRERNNRRYGMFEKNLCVKDLGDLTNFCDYLHLKYGNSLWRKVHEYGRDHNGEKRKWEKMWPELTGRTYFQLLEDWRNADRITDPVFLWSCDGTDEGLSRRMGRYCDFHHGKFSDPAKGQMSENARGDIKGEMDIDGNWTLAMRGAFRPEGDRVKMPVFTIGSSEEKGSRLFAVMAARDALYAALLRVTKGGSLEEAEKPVKICGKPQDFHSLVVLKRADKFVVCADGERVAKFDMPRACAEFKFAPRIRFGRISGSVKPSSPLARGGWRDMQGGDTFMIHDARLFRRVLNAREVAMYFNTYSAQFTPLKAVTARWIAKPDGDMDLTNPDNWECVNTAGENVRSVPDETTAVTAWGPTVPQVPRGTTLPCESFTIEKWVDTDRDTNLMGIGKTVQLADYAVIHSAEHWLCMSNAVGENLILRGRLAVASMKLSGRFEMMPGAVLAVPASAKAPVTVAGEFRRIPGSSNAIRLMGTSRIAPRKKYEILRAEGGLPKDVSEMEVVDCPPGIRAEVFTDDGKTLKIRTFRHK